MGTFKKNNYPIKFWIKTPFSGHHEKEKLLYKNSVIFLILYVITINFEKNHHFTCRILNVSLYNFKENLKHEIKILEETLYRFVQKVK
ncbi:hypothetical protein LEP1GSC158_5295 [Leptospira interrogans serovar Zanoni str. LT2156]|uniref:Uncharacterized protein n=1 Tax=Leptospira interrogans serovar Zanoni str. LT2156 TaxID=1001601 RepID=M6HE34_LEPIR|nr:hypothetical protein LEP1GSC158_5295 [Leptospira interrogans serovar Zanoni str. LT2156]